MLEFIGPVVATGLLAFLDEQQQFRFLLLTIGLLACLILLSMRDSLEEIAALGYEIRNLRSYLRPSSATPESVPVARPGSSDHGTPPDVAAESSVQTPATEGTEQTL
jgi:hypothetical protein